MDTKIVLGDFEFENMEIPAQINFGGEQKLIVHELVGGQRIIDAMGKSDANISWSGLMLGPDSLNRAMQLDTLRVAGQPLVLTWFNLRYYVLIENFTANTERYYQVNYSISLKIVQDFNHPADILSLLGFDDSIINDFTIANQIAGLINNPTLNAAMAQVNTAISAVSSFKNAPVATINSVLGPVGNALGVVASQITSVHQKLFT